jgi:hypothetical protein
MKGRTKWLSPSFDTTADSMGDAAAGIPGLCDTFGTVTELSALAAPRARLAGPDRTLHKPITSAGRPPYVKGQNLTGKRRHHDRFCGRQPECHDAVGTRAHPFLECRWHAARRWSAQRSGHLLLARRNGGRLQLQRVLVRPGRDHFDRQSGCGLRCAGGCDDDILGGYHLRQRGHDHGRDGHRAQPIRSGNVRARRPRLEHGHVIRDNGTLRIPLSGGCPM